MVMIKLFAVLLNVQVILGKILEEELRFRVLPLKGTFKFVCPPQAHWSLRAKSECAPAKDYTCLYDKNLHRYTERCSSPRILAAGFKYVIQLNLNRKMCSSTRYQPFIFDTMGYSDCTFLKSLCNSEGQMMFKNGDTTSDRTCMCNTDEGYTFVTNPKKQFYCNPSSEDCSCFIGRSRSHKRINSRDLKSYAEENIVQRHERSSRQDAYKQSQTIKINYFDNFKYNIEGFKKNSRTEAVLCIIIMLLLYLVSVGAVFVIPVILQRNKQQLINTASLDDQSLEEIVLENSKDIINQTDFPENSVDTVVLQKDDLKRENNDATTVDENVDKNVNNLSVKEEILV